MGIVVELMLKMVVCLFLERNTTRNIHFYDENLNDESETIIEERFL